MINEGIEQTTVQFAAETNPFRMKKFLKNHLLAHGIKVAEDRTMKRRNSGIMSRESTYDNDLFNGITFYVHDSSNIKVQAKGNRILVQAGDSSFTNPMGDITVEELGDFIVQSYKKRTTKEKTEPTTTFKENINSIDLGEKYKIIYDPTHYSNDIEVHINTHKFETGHSSKLKITTTIMRLLSDPVVKRSLSKEYKDISNDRFYTITIGMDKLQLMKSDLLSDIDLIVDKIFQFNPSVAYAEFDSRNQRIRFVLPRNKSYERKKLKAKKQYMSDKEVKMRLKKQVIASVSDIERKRNKIFSVASEISHPIIKRFFKEPEKYI